MFGDRFANPGFLYLLLLIPALGFYLWWKRKTIVADVKYSALRQFSGASPSLRERLSRLPLWLRIAALTAFIIALARPQSVSSGENISTQGIDIVLVSDISGSMLSEDFTPNRLEAAKDVADDFIKGRVSDRIGLVVFSAESFTQCPLTTDYAVLRKMLREIKFGMIEDGTAIGLAVANGVNRLKDSKAKSKVMILLTDGVNNRGEIDPISAAKIAATFGIRIYTIGVGAMGSAPYPVQTPFGIRRQLVPVEIDEKTLTTVADLTGGKYYRATDNQKLKMIYKDIDKLEKTRIEVTAYKRYGERYYSWMWLGLILLATELLLSSSVLKKIP
jgi:Ca-activated chloride channel family protein